MNARISILALTLCAACGARESSVRGEAPAGAQAQGAAKATAASAHDDVPSFEWRGAMQDDWLSWRGPHQNGVSDDPSPPLAIDPAKPLWSAPISGRGTPVVADGLVYVMGYQGEGATAVELLACLDERTGEVLWQELFPDFLSDVVYTRYSIGAPTIDPETGNVYCQTSPGRVIAFTRGGKKLWEHSTMEEYGKLTFPNGRTGAPLVVGDRVIVHLINANWGPLARAADRFFAFDKKTGECIWGNSTPGETPIDNSFSMPVVEERGGKSVFYAETGCGHVVCIDVATGDPLWRFRMATGAANSSPVLDGERIIAVHGGENLDTSTQGRMVALRLPANPAQGPKGVAELEPAAEVWRADLEAFSSSPVLAGGRVYLTNEDGELACVNAESGALLWKHKLASDQVHASPLFAGGKLYVPMNTGSFYVLEPSDAGPKVLDEDLLEGNCLGAPALANGRLYVHTTAKLYCFGTQARYPDKPVAAAPAPAPAGAPVRLQLVPGDFEIQAGKSFALRARSLDANGRVVADPAPDVTFTADAPLALKNDSPGHWSVQREARGGTGAIHAEGGGLKGEARVRVVPALPYKEDFEGAKLDQPKADAPPEQLFGFPPPFWLSGRMKWDVRVKDGNKVLGRTLDNPLFQRTQSLLGDPGDSNYTVQGDVMVEGNRRGMASVGLINQRYLVWLKGNYQELEVSSNFESLKVSTPFPIKVGAWYTLKTRVDLQPDGSAMVRAKCWPKGESEPTAWTIEVPHQHAHKNGAAGVYGFTLENRFKAYVDNLSVTPNE